MRWRSIFLVLSWVLLGTTAPLTAGWDEGVAAFRAAEFDSAADHFQMLVEHEPESWRSHYLLGLTLEALDRKPDSLTAFKQAAIILNRLASATISDEETKITGPDYDVESGRIAVELVEPLGHWQPSVFLGISLAAGDQRVEAIEVFEQALKKGPRPAGQKMIWQQLARCFEDELRFAEAAHAFRMAHDPANAERAAARINSM